MGELLRQIDSRELTEWQAYAQLEPFGPGRADMRAGLIATLLALAHGGKYVAPDQWLEAAEAKEESQPLSLEQMEREVMRWAVNTGGKVRRGAPVQ